MLVTCDSCNTRNIHVYMCDALGDIKPACIAGGGMRAIQKVGCLVSWHALQLLLFFRWLPQLPVAAVGSQVALPAFRLVCSLLPCSLLFAFACCVFTRGDGNEVPEPKRRLVRMQESRTDTYFVVGISTFNNKAAVTKQTPAVKAHPTICYFSICVLYIYIYTHTHCARTYIRRSVYKYICIQFLK